MDEAPPLARARSRRLVVGILSAGGARALVLLAPFLTLPIMFSALGPPAYGLLSLAASLTAVAAFADLGLGNGMLTLLPQALARDSADDARRITSTGYALLGGVGLLVLAITAVLWTSGAIRGLAASVAGEVDPVLAESIIVMTVVSFALTVPLTLIQRIQYAVQEAWASSLWQIAAAAIALVAVFGAAILQLAPAALVAASLFALPLTLALNTTVFFTRKRHRELRPSPAHVSLRAARSMLGLGLGFLALSIITSLALNADNVIVAAVTDLTSVAAYSIAARLFSVLSIAITFTALPLWPANSDALARGDLAWVRRATRVMMLASTLVVLVAGTVLVVGRDLVTAIWLDGAVLIPLGLAAGLAAWSTAVAFSSPLFSVQNAKGVLIYQTCAWAGYLAASVPLKAWALASFGVAAVPLTGVLLYVVIVIPGAWIGYRKTLARTRAEMGDPS
ncbi:MAG TPA: oligosaccharide flippase family protein [Sorangium sp.]|nr:oligosaccharide flippase family protein [Sorangium sp.]